MFRTLSKILVTLVFGAWLLSWSQARAASQPFWLDAEEYNTTGKNLAELKGNVKIIRGKEQLTCDYARVNMATKDVVAQGHVLYITPLIFIRADKFIYNFETQRGTLENALVQADQVTLEGRLIDKVGPKEFIAQDGTYTACTTCPPSWKFSSTKVTATLGEYAFLKNAVFRTYGAPILFFPYLVVPIKSERQTGLLTPQFSWEQGYFHYMQPFFWAIDKSHDATLTEHFYAKRGYKTETEYRYVLNETSRGQFKGSYINDRLFGESDRYLNTHPNEGPSAVQRYALHYDHHFDLPSHISNNLQVNSVRDLQYPVDFPQEIKGAGDPALETKMSFTKNTEHTHAGLDSTYYQNLLQSDPLASNERSVHKIPELRYSVLEQSVLGSGLLFAADIDYTNFTRQSTTFLDGNRNGIYDPNYPDDPALRDIARTGQRLIFEPRVLYPINFGRYLDVVPSVSLNDVNYQFGYGDQTQANRYYIKAEVTGRSRFARVYGATNDPKATRYKHEFQPEVTYSVVPYFYRDNHIFFGVLDTEPVYLSRQPINETDQIQFDYYDRLVDRHLVTYGVTNKLIRKRLMPDQSFQYREIVRHSLTQSYDIFDADRTNEGNIKKQPYSEVTSTLAVKLDAFAVNSEINYFPYQNITSNSSTLSMFDYRGDAISLSYLNTFIIPRAREAPAQSLTETINAGITLVTKYFNLYGSGQYSPRSNEHWQSYDAATLIKFPGQCLGFLLGYRNLIGSRESQYYFTLPIYFGGGKQLNVGRPTSL